jgi:hypothetical protein
MSRTKTFVTFLLMTYSALAQASITRVQSNSGAAGATTSITVAYSSPNVAGNTLTAFAISSYSTNPGTPTITDSQSQIWTTDVTDTRNAYDSLAVFHLFNCASGTNSVTVHWPAIGNPIVILFEHSGVGAPLFAVKPITDVTSSPIPTGAAFLPGGLLVFSFGAYEYISGGTFSSSWTGGVTRAGVSNGGAMVVYDSFPAAGGTFSNSISVSGSVNTAHGGLIAFGTGTSVQPNVTMISTNTPPPSGGVGIPPA